MGSDGLGGNRFVTWETTLLQWEEVVTWGSLSLLHLLLSFLPPIPRSQTPQLAPAPGFESVYAFLHHYHQTVCQHVFRNNLLRFQAQRQEGPAIPVGGSEGQGRAGHQHRQQMRLHPSIRGS